MLNLLACNQKSDKAEAAIYRAVFVVVQLHEESKDPLSYANLV